MRVCFLTPCKAEDTVSDLPALVSVLAIVKDTGTNAVAIKDPNASVMDFLGLLYVSFSLLKLRV